MRPHGRETAERQGRRLGTARNTQLRLEARQPLRHIGLAELELGSDLGIGPALGQELEDTAIDLLDAIGRVLRVSPFRGGGDRSLLGARELGE